MWIIILKKHRKHVFFTTNQPSSNHLTPTENLPLNLIWSMKILFKKSLNNHENPPRKPLDNHWNQQNPIENHGKPTLIHPWNHPAETTSPSAPRSSGHSSAFVCCRSCAAPDAARRSAARRRSWHCSGAWSTCGGRWRWPQGEVVD